MSGGIVIVGASLAGLTAAEALRNHRYHGRITMIGDETDMPYDRTPLSKIVIAGDVPATATTLPRRLTSHDPAIDWHTGIAATRVDPQRKTVSLADNTEIAFDKLLIATGARARQWAQADEAALAGVVTLRGRKDAEQLGALLAKAPERVLIIGGGFMGCELASSCRQMGLSVTLVERGSAPLSGALGATLAAHTGELQRRKGVDLRCNTSVIRLIGDADGQFRQAELADGTTIDADVAIVALGAIPNSDWLAGTGLDVTEAGVACDSACRAFDENGTAHDIFAAGDVARFPHPQEPDAFLRLEHWDNAIHMAEIVAHNMTHDPADQRHHRPVPAFWSSQFDTNIKSLGLLSAADRVVIAQGSIEKGKFIAVYGRGDEVVGAVAFNEGRNLSSYLRLITAHAPFPPGIIVGDPADDDTVKPAGFKARA